EATARGSAASGSLSTAGADDDFPGTTSVAPAVGALRPATDSAAVVASAARRQVGMGFVTEFLQRFRLHGRHSGSAARLPYPNRDQYVTISYQMSPSKSNHVQTFCSVTVPVGPDRVGPAGGH